MRLASPSPCSLLALCLAASALMACSASGPAERDPEAPSGPVGTAEPAEAPGAADPEESDAGVPQKLREVSSGFGMRMIGTWQWVETDRMQTRFDWTGKPPSEDLEVRWSFWQKGEDVRTVSRLLVPVVESAARNLTQKDTCEPFEQPPELAQLVGADRVITVCFEPAPFMSQTYKRGVLHGLLRGDTLVIVVVLANGFAGTVPLPEHLGGRFVGR